MFNVRTETVKKEGKPVTLIFKSDLDVSGTGLEKDTDVKLKERNGVMVSTLELNDIPMHVHTLDRFTALIRQVFGEEVEHRLLPDFRDDGAAEFRPNYWVHVIVKS